MVNFTVNGSRADLLAGLKSVIEAVENNKTQTDYNLCKYKHCVLGVNFATDDMWNNEGHWCEIKMLKKVFNMDVYPNSESRVWCLCEYSHKDNSPFNPDQTKVLQLFSDWCFTNSSYVPTHIWLMKANQIYREMMGL